MPENDYSGIILDEQYRIIKLLGEGSMGAVYLAQQLSDNAQVAIKFLHGDLTSNEVSLKRFFREARAAAELNHEHIIQILDVGVSDYEEPYIVMEYLEGETLADLLKRSAPLKLDTAVQIVKPILLALQAIHDKGILHRDIRPNKIFLIRRANQAPLVKLIDFGMSKFTESADPSTGLTVAGVMLGSLSYISPEQVRNASDVTQCSDVYSVSTIFYEMLTGKLPFANVAPNDQLRVKLVEEIPHPETLYPGFPKVAGPFLVRALTNAPGPRPQTAREMLSELDRLLQPGAVAGAGSQPKVIGGYDDRPTSVDGADTSNPAKGGGDSKVAEIIQFVTGTTKGRIIGAGAIVGILLAIILPIALSGGNDAPETQPQTAAAATPAPATGAQEPDTSTADTAAIEPKDEKPTDVELEVRGMPTGAKIYYNDAPVPTNPFRVELKEVIVALKVEAEGYNTYTTSVVPAEDQVIRIEMTPKQAEPKADTDSKDTSAEEDADQVDESEVADSQPEETAPEPAPTKQKSTSHHKKTKKKKKKPSSKFSSSFD